MRSGVPNLEPGLFAVKCDRGATLPERRQSIFALKRHAGEVNSEITCEKFKHRVERREYDETLALLPSLLQDCTSIDAVL